MITCYGLRELNSVSPFSETGLYFRNSVQSLKECSLHNKTPRPQLISCWWSTVGRVIRTRWKGGVEGVGDGTWSFEQSSGNAQRRRCNCYQEQVWDHKKKELRYITLIVTRSVHFLKWRHLITMEVGTGVANHGRCVWTWNSVLFLVTSHILW